MITATTATTARRALNGRASAPPTPPSSANVATRGAAFLVDVVVLNVVFALGGAVAERILGLFTGHPMALTDAELANRIAWVAWVLLYCMYPLATTGRTVGMAVLGVKAVDRTGADLTPLRAVLRVLVFPLSFLLLGAGFALIVLRRDHRALHDLIVGSKVVYAATPLPAVRGRGGT